MFKNIRIIYKLWWFVKKVEIVYREEYVFSGVECSLIDVWVSVDFRWIFEIFFKENICVESDDVKGEEYEKFELFFFF